MEAIRRKEIRKQTSSIFEIERASFYTNKHLKSDNFYVEITTSFTPCNRETWIIRAVKTRDEVHVKIVVKAKITSK